MGVLEDILGLLNSAVDAVEKASAAIEELKKSLSDHPNIDDSATKDIEEAVKKILGEK